MGQFATIVKSALAGLAILALTFIVLATAPRLAPTAARSSVEAMPANAAPVTVSVSYNTQIPLPDASEAAQAQAQKAGRENLYKLSSRECDLLLQTIAKTCRLTNLSVNSRVQPGNQGLLMLYINGSANFTISLKDEQG